jgi:hypothetical protein
VNIEEVRALFAGETATRLKTIIDRLDSIDAEMEKLTKERSDLDAELTKILAEISPSIARPSQVIERRKRRCKLCGREGHIIARKKATTDAIPARHTRKGSRFPRSSIKRMTGLQLPSRRRYFLHCAVNLNPKAGK